MPKLRWMAALSAAFVFMTAPCAAVTLRYAGTTAPLTMDPHSTNDFVTTSLVRQVYDSLVGLSNNMEVVPGLATEWRYEGNNTWRFKIRQGVKFHDGSALTADDVVFSIMRQKSSSLYASLFGSIKQATKVDANTVDVVSTVPDPILPRRMVRLFVMSQAWANANNVEKVPDLAAQATEAHSLRHANGTGPMRLVSQEPGRRTVFQRNRAYWAPANGNVDDAVYTPIASAPTRIAALLSGEVDLITDLPLQDIERVKGTQGLKMLEVPQVLLMMLEMDGSRDVALDVFDKNGQPLKANPLKDLRVRRAFAHAVDANLLVQRVMRGHARVAGIPAAPGFAGYQREADQRWPTDVAKAKALLAEAGYPNGFVIQLNCPSDRYINSEELCKGTASLLARIGVDVKVKSMVWSEFSRMLVQGPNSSFHLIGAAGNSGDVQDMFSAVVATRDKQKNRGGQNWAMWTSREFDANLDQLVATFEPAKRAELYRKGLEIARDQVHAVYLHQPYLLWGMKAGVTVPPRADSSVMLHEAVLK